MIEEATTFKRSTSEDNKSTHPTRGMLPGSLSSDAADEETISVGEELDFFDHVSPHYPPPSPELPLTSSPSSSTSVPPRWAAGWSRADDWLFATKSGSQTSTTTARTGRTSSTGCRRAALWRQRQQIPRLSSFI